MKQFMMLLIVGIIPLTQLAAQSTDPELAQKLNSVMSLFDKNQKALKDEIAALNASNMALTQANLSLFQDLQSTQKRMEDLESENILLRSKISEVAIRELESASLNGIRKDPPSNTLPQLEPRSDEAQSEVSQGDQKSSDGQLININSASLEELLTLPLINKEMAEQIISNRPYSTIEDLIINQGFGPMKLRRISAFITAE
jgi:DNA uptake protein ComE-like DNA-binding protein